jgi:hypothetical protein
MSAAVAFVESAALWIRATQSEVAYWQILHKASRCLSQKYQGWLD